jgi:fused signal recognition particle receptor
LEIKNTVQDTMSSPHIILVVGVNGTGKTTSIGKLAHLYTKAGKSVLLVAGDTFRAAAIEQLSIWSERSGAELIKKDAQDPSAVIYDALQSAKQRGIDVVIIDTAGRLHTQKNLMIELDKIQRVVKKVIPDAPHETVLTIDATTGQNGLIQAQQFSNVTPVDHLFLTKLDGTAKGGIAIAIHHKLDIPVKYIGIGEQIGDIQNFDAISYVEAFFEISDS